MKGLLIYSIHLSFQFFRQRRCCVALALMLSLFFDFSSAVYAQGEANNQKFIHYSTRLGLSSSNQSCIVQDKEGFIWIGTNNGLDRFDGYTFKEYRKMPKDSTSLAGNKIYALFVDSRGTLWVGTSPGGLCRYNRETDNFTNYTFDPNNNYSLSNNVVSSIAEDNQHRLWVGTFNGLNLFDAVQNRFIRFQYDEHDPKHSIANNQVRAIVQDCEVLWIAYASGTISALDVSSMNFKHYELFHLDMQNRADCFVNSFCVDGNKLWISTWGKGIWIFDKRFHQSYPYTQLNYPFVNSICKDNKNNIWIGTESNGLIQLDLKRECKAIYTHDDFNKQSLSNNCVSHIFVDQQNNLWLSSKKGDVHYFLVDNPFRSWMRNPSSIKALSNNHVTCMLETHENELWVSFLDGGIDLFNLKTKTKRFINGETQSNGLGKGTVITMHKDQQNEIWLGTYLDGLKRYDKKTGRFLTYHLDPKKNKSLSGNDVRCIAEDSKGNLWLAIHGGGLNKFNKKTGEAEPIRVDYKYFDRSPITSDWLTCVHCDPKDNLWVGSVSGASFISSDFKTVKHFVADAKNPSSLSNDNVNVIFEDSYHTIWLGTNDGLNRYNKETNSFTVYTTKDGLPNNFILGIQEDKKHHLWISTNKGLSEFCPNYTLYKNYFVDDGLATDEFNVGSCFKNAQNELYFGGLEGLILFNPDSIKTNTYSTPVYITDFKLFNHSVPIKKGDGDPPFVLEKPINQCKEIVLDYDQNVFGFEFVALNYINLQKNLYSYKMDGFDKDWSTPGIKRDVTYTNLHDGIYTFRVKACNNQGVWNAQGVSIRIVIKPPWWRSRLAMFICFLLIIAVLYVFRLLILRDANIKRKLELETLAVEKLQELDEQKMKFFSNVSHEFRTPLTLIVGPLEKLLNASKDELQRIELKLIHRNAQRLLRLINQLMDFSKLEVSGLDVNLTSDDLIRFVRELSNAFVYEAKKRNINYRFESSIDSLCICFDKDKLDKILYNLLSNAFKFTTDGGEIEISIHAESHDSLLFCVTDSGTGIPSEAQAKIFDRFYQVKHSNGYGTGIGLSLTKELVQLLNGKIWLESVEGKGSRFMVSLPIPPLQETAPVSTESTEPRIDSSAWSYQDIESTKQNENHQADLPVLLIVEDNADMRLFIQSEFVDSYRIIEVANGALGLEAALAEIPDVVISDVMMPVMDGVEFCMRLKSDERTSHIPVVMLTARSSDEHAVLGLESGADDYIVKPFNASILRLKIRNIIQTRKRYQTRFVQEPSASIKEIAPTALDEKFLKKAYQVVEKNIENADLDANDFAIAVGMSRAQVYRKITAITGQTVKEFIRIIRLKKAAELLTTQDDNVTEIAFKVGFNSVAYFTKSFTDYYGVSPTKYIAQQKEA